MDADEGIALVLGAERIDADVTAEAALEIGRAHV